jgi:hypothetical protein
MFDEQRVDLVLRERVTVGELAGVDELRARARACQQRGVCETVVDHDVGFGEARGATDGDQRRITRPCAYE